VKVSLLHSSEIDHIQWDNFVDNSPQGSVFTKSWYLEALGEKWYGLIAEDTNGFIALMPLVQKKKLFLKYSLQPVLTKYWGILFQEETEQENTYKKFQSRKKITEAFINEMPEFNRFEYYFSPDFDYPLPFFWKGYSLNTRFTCQLDLTVSSEERRKNYKPSVMQMLRKAQNNGFKIKAEASVTTLINVLSENQKAGKKLLEKRYHKRLENIFKAAVKNNSVFVLSAFDENETSVASAIFLFDKKFTYYILGAVHPDFRNSGIMNWIFDEAFEIAKTKSQKFDFYGSMIESIETFFRSFGAVPVPYLAVKK
jgi:hypothetical protein